MEKSLEDLERLSFKEEFGHETHLKYRAEVEIISDEKLDSRKVWETLEIALERGVDKIPHAARYKMVYVEENSV